MVMLGEDGVFGRDLDVEPALSERRHLAGWTGRCPGGSYRPDAGVTGRRDAGAPHQHPRNAHASEAHEIAQQERAAARREGGGVGHGDHRAGAEDVGGDRVLQMSLGDLLLRHLLQHVVERAAPEDDLSFQIDHPLAG